MHLHPTREFRCYLHPWQVPEHERKFCQRLLTSTWLHAGRLLEVVKHQDLMLLARVLFRGIRSKFVFMSMRTAVVPGFVRN